MSEMWFYTSDGKQMDPVPLGELKRLAGEGGLKPTDMVWTDGMAKWTRASAVRELFSDSSAPDHQITQNRDTDNVTAPANAPAAVAAKTSPPGEEIEEAPRRRSRARDEDVPARRRPDPARAGSSFGIVVALIIGAVVILGSLAVGVVILITMSQNAGDGKINLANLVKSEVRYDVQLAVNARESRKFSFRKGVEYEFIVKTQPRIINVVDVDLHVFNANGDQVAFDIADHPDCYTRWVPQHDGEYRVEIVNLDNNRPNTVPVKSVVTIREFKDANKIDKKDDKDQPLPPDTFEGKGLKDVEFTGTKKEDVKKFRVRAGHNASFTFVHTKAGANADFNIVVVKDSDPNQIIAQDNDPKARANVSFTLQATEIVRVTVVSVKGGAGKGVLSYDASP